MAMTKENAGKIIQSRVQCLELAKYTVRVTGVTPFVREDGTPIHIVNVNAMTAAQVATAKAAWKAEDYDAAVGRGTSLSTSIRAGQYVPSKGEIVDIELGEIISKDGEVLTVINALTPRKAIQATQLSVSAWDDEEEDADDNSFVEESADIATAKTK